VHGEKETEGEESKTEREKMRERGVGVLIPSPKSSDDGGHLLPDRRPGHCQAAACLNGGRG
jgi:hypothetical protein